MLLSPNASFELALRVNREGGPIGEVFSFLSGLYFRGKVAYAQAFGCRADHGPSSFVITTERGLVTLDTVVTRDDLRAFADVDLASADDRFVAPLARDVARLAEQIDRSARIVLLGSIATGKYVDALIATFGARLLFPEEFVGRGDMSRGGLMLRSAADGRELSYLPVLGAVRRGKRPPKLEPRRYSKK
jgi:hypothetical protein